MAELRVKDIKNREVVYGCAFNIDFDKNRWYGGQVVHNICKPIKGMVEKYEDYDSYRTKFNTMEPSVPSFTAY